MSREMYFTAIKVDSPKSDKPLFDAHSLYPENFVDTSFCIDEDKYDSTERLYIKGIKRRSYEYMAINCIFNRKLSPHSITKDLRLKKGDPNNIKRWFSELAKDEEFADALEESVNRMRELKLH